MPVAMATAVVKPRTRQSSGSSSMLAERPSGCSTSRAARPHHAKTRPAAAQARELKASAHEQELAAARLQIQLSDAEAQRAEANRRIAAAQANSERSRSAALGPLQSQLETCQRDLQAAQDQLGQRAQQIAALQLEMAQDRAQVERLTAEAFTNGVVTLDGTADVTVSGGSVTRANVDTDIVQGAVLVYAGNAGKYVRNVAISDVDIVDTTPSAERNVAVVLGGGRVEGISFSRIHVSQSSLPLLTSDAPQSDYATSDWTLDGSPVDVAG